MNKFIKDKRLSKTFLKKLQGLNDLQRYRLLHRQLQLLLDQMLLRHQVPTLLSGLKLINTAVPVPKKTSINVPKNSAIIFLIKYLLNISSNIYYKMKKVTFILRNIDLREKTFKVFSLTFSSFLPVSYLDKRYKLLNL